VSEESRPKLRVVDLRPIIHQGRPAVLVSDPLRLTDRVLVVPQPLVPLLMLCDGTRDVGRLRAAAALRFGLRVGPEAVEELVSALDNALLLENERFAGALERARADYHAAPFRPLTHAGQSYPADVDELRGWLGEQLAAADVGPAGPHIRGVISPHIDFLRGAPVYARLWKRAAEAARAADLAILLGTDHNGGAGRVTLTRQHYATPFGVLPTAREIVDELAGMLGEIAFAEEIHHRSEHSLELAAVWLHFVRQEMPCQTLPILCGSFAGFVGAAGDPQDDPTFAALTDTLRRATAGRRVFVVAAADLAHVGPAFGGPAQSPLDRARLETTDRELIERACAGDAAGFFAAIRRVGDRCNVCGLPPIYLALRTLGPLAGELVGYAQCPADDEGTSWVSICGVVLG